MKQHYNRSYLSGVYGYIGLESLKRRHFCPYHDKGKLRVRLNDERESAAGAGLFIRFNKWGKGEKDAALSIPGIPDQRMTSEGARKSSCTHCKHSMHLSVCGQYRKRHNVKLPLHLHQFNCFQECMLAFDGPWTVFQQISHFHRELGGGGPGGRKVRERQKELIQIATYRTYKYSWPLRGITDLC